MWFLVRSNPYPASPRKPYWLRWNTSSSTKRRRLKASRTLCPQNGPHFFQFLLGRSLDYGKFGLSTLQCSDLRLGLVIKGTWLSRLVHHLLKGYLTFVV